MEVSMMITSIDMQDSKAAATTAASGPRPRLVPRSAEEIYKLPKIALVTPAEASLITQLTESALAVRRSKGEWPRYLKFGRLVRYRLGDLIDSPTAFPDPTDGVAR
jgi:hypothetical protein